MLIRCGTSHGTPSTSLGGDLFPIHSLEIVIFRKSPVKEAIRHAFRRRAKHVSAKDDYACKRYLCFVDHAETLGVTGGDGTTHPM